MQDLFNWSLEEYENLETITLKELEEAPPTILKHRYKFKELPIHVYDPNKQLFMNGTMFYRYDGFIFNLYDKTIILINLKHIEMTILDQDNFIVINNGNFLQFKDEEDKKSFIDYFTLYNSRVRNINKSLCKKALNLYKDLSVNTDIKNAINNLIDMLPEDMFLSGETFYMILMKLCIMDVKFNAFLDVTLTQEDICKDLRLSYSNVCNVIENIPELQNIYALITQFNELIANEYNIDFSYTYILTYLFIMDEITKKYSKVWETQVNVSENFTNDEEYIRFCYENNLIMSEDEQYLSYLVYYLKSKNDTYDFSLKKSIEKIQTLLTELKTNTQKNIFAKNIFKDRTKPEETENIKITIDDIDLMTGVEFEDFIAKLFIKMGYSAYTTKTSGDQGIDVIAEKNGTQYGIQCKCYANAVSNSAIQEVVAGKQLYHLDKLIVITNNYFTKSAQELAHANNVILWDRTILKEKINGI